MMSDFLSSHRKLGASPLLERIGDHYQSARRNDYFEIRNAIESNPTAAHQHQEPASPDRLLTRKNFGLVREKLRHSKEHDRILEWITVRYKAAQDLDQSDILALIGCEPNAHHLHKETLSLGRLLTRQEYRLIREGLVSLLKHRDWMDEAETVSMINQSIGIDSIKHAELRSSIARKLGYSGEDLTGLIRLAVKIYLRHG